jgi:hypothetical protein
MSSVRAPGIGWLPGFVFDGSRPQHKTNAAPKAHVDGGFPWSDVTTRQRNAGPTAKTGWMSAGC